MVKFVVVCADERDISPTHKFYASLQDGDPPEEEKEEEVGTPFFKGQGSCILVEEM